MRHERLLIGLGTGRCGTVSLATLLANQDGASVMHEVAGPDFEFRSQWLPFYGGALACHPSCERDFLARFLRAFPPGKKFTGDVGFYYLPWVRAIAELWGDVRFVCMERDRSEAVESLCWKARAGGRNPWTNHDGTKWRQHRVDVTFPKFPGMRTLEDGCGKYWDYYAKTARELAALLPGRFAIFGTESLNDPTGVRAILQFCGFENPKILGPLRLNSREIYKREAATACP